VEVVGGLAAATQKTTAGFVLRVRGHDDGDRHSPCAVHDVAVSGDVPSDALTAKCIVCAAQGIQRGLNSDNAYFTLAPASDVDEQMWQSRTPSRSRKRRVHASMLTCS